jgi:hypothetical protein
MPKTWTEREIVDLMLNAIREVTMDCVQRGISYKIEDAINQVYHDLNEQGLIEHTP